MAKPFAPSCENNKSPILQVLQRWVQTGDRVLELGSGTGQHACYFAESLPGVEWQPTDVSDNLPGIRQWCDESPATNLLPPLELDARWASWPGIAVEAIFTANTLHIMAWSAVENLFQRLSDSALEESLLLLYGPFNYGGEYTSPSNAKFDQWLAAQNPDSAIRDFEAVEELARGAGYQLLEDNTMPANNRLLVWRKLSHPA